MSLDRFSSPLNTERVHPYHLQQAIQEQMELNKENMVDSYIDQHWNNYGLVPSIDEIQEFFMDVDLDQDMIEERIELF